MVSALAAVIFRWLALALAGLAATTFAILLLMTGSVVLPVEALLRRIGLSEAPA